MRCKHTWKETIPWRNNPSELREFKCTKCGKLIHKIQHDWELLIDDFDFFVYQEYFTEEYQCDHCLEYRNIVYEKVLLEETCRRNIPRGAYALRAIREVRERRTEMARSVNTGLDILKIYNPRKDKFVKFSYITAS